MAKQFDNSSLRDYVEVPERIMEFYAKFPDGRLTTQEVRVIEVGSKTFIAATALAYRAEDDATPCVGTSWEPFPGTTPYTRNSEAENAETSAWGRAIVAAGVPAKGSIASANEVRNRKAEQDAEARPARKRAPAKAKPAPAPAAEPAPVEEVSGVGDTPEPEPAPPAPERHATPAEPTEKASPDQLKNLARLWKQTGLKDDDLRWLLTSVGVQDAATANLKDAMTGLNSAQATELVEEFSKAIADKQEA